MRRERLPVKWTITYRELAGWSNDNERYGDSTYSYCYSCRSAIGRHRENWTYGGYTSFLVFDFGAAQRGTGSVCVAARIDDPFWKEPPTLPNGEINSHGLKVRVDTGPVEEWPQRKSLKIDGLDTSERHLLVVLDSSGKPIESVRFKFSDYKSTELCMAYDGYQGIGLQEATRRTPWCKCR